MARLYKHGEVKAEYKRAKPDIDRGQETSVITYRVMADGAVLRRVQILMEDGGRTLSEWKVAKNLKPEIKADMDLLLTKGFIKTV